MSLLSASDLATALGVSKVRVSQLTSGGRLDGCWQGEGRARRYDLQKVATQLGRVLDRGQMMGNGAATKRTLAALKVDRVETDDEDLVPAPAARAAQRDGSPLDGKDPDRYDLARTQKAEEETRRLRRQNAEAEGRYVLASEVERQVARLISQEIAEFEAVLRDGSRKVADALGVDFKKVRQLMLDQWRAHRAGRTKVLDLQAEAAAASAAEIEEDI